MAQMRFRLDSVCRRFMLQRWATLDTHACDTYDVPVGPVSRTELGRNFTIRRVTNDTQDTTLVLVTNHRHEQIVVRPGRSTETAFSPWKLPFTPKTWIARCKVVEVKARDLQGRIPDGIVLPKGSTGDMVRIPSILIPYEVTFGALEVVNNPQ
jgi:hypothetical protein